MDKSVKQEKITDFTLSVSSAQGIGQIPVSHFHPPHRRGDEFETITVHANFVRHFDIDTVSTESVILGQGGEVKKLPLGMTALLLSRSFGKVSSGNSLYSGLS